MRRVLAAALLVLPPFLASCGGDNQDKYVQAAVGTGLAVAATGVNRAVTGDCWARCSPGYLCNEQNGLCERGECYPDCEVGTHCVRDMRGTYLCAVDMTPAPPPKAPATTTQPTAPQTYPGPIMTPLPR